MRFLFAALALTVLAACGQPGPPAPAPTEGFTLQVFVRESEQIYLVTHSDGRAVAARVAAGVSELYPAEDAQRMVSDRMGVLGADAEPKLNFSVPGFSLSVAAGEKAEDSRQERARVAINVGGREILVDADDGVGPDSERAAVRVAGVSESEVREFIAEAENMSAETKAAMLAALNLGPPTEGSAQ